MPSAYLARPCRRPPAAFVSRLNQCVFSTNAHSAVAEAALGDDTMRLVLADHRTAPIDAPLRATLELLERMTLAPDAFGHR